MIRRTVNRIAGRSVRQRITFAGFVALGFAAVHFGVPLVWILGAYALGLASGYFDAEDDVERRIRESTYRYVAGVEDDFAKAIDTLHEARRRLKELGQ
jgi:hypothetical protein